MNTIHQLWGLEMNSLTFVTLPLYEIFNLNMVINLLCCSFDNALISTSTTMSSLNNTNMTSPFSTRFLTKWCWTSMCFVQTCWFGFLLCLSCHIKSPSFSSLFCTLILSWTLSWTYGFLSSLGACLVFGLSYWQNN